MTVVTQGLPEFVVVGAAKAATTWIANQLRSRDDVFIPGPEPHYFSSEFDRGEEWYRSWFVDARPDQTISEKSADYLAHEQAPERMARLLPDARIVIQLRNPVDRAYSDYCMYFRRGTVDGDIARFLGSPDHAFPRFLVDGLYHRHIQRFLDWFPEDRIKIIFYDDIRSRPLEVVREVTQFLNLPDQGDRLALAERANVKDAPMLPLPVRKAFAPVKALVKPLRSKPWFTALHRRLAREVEYPELGGDLRASMRDFYAADVENLGALLDRDLTHWLAK